MRENKKILKALYGSIVLFGFMSISIEFGLVESILAFFLNPDPFSSIMFHLQNHSDFYKSIALGGLASAIISVIAVQVSIANHKKDTFLRYFLAARRLAGIFERTIFKINYFKDLVKLEELECSNSIFGEQIESFFNEVELNREEGNSLPQYMILLCENTFIPLQEDIKDFLSSVKESGWFNDRKNTMDWNEQFYSSICQKCVRIFSEEIDDKYNINKVFTELYRKGFLSSNYPKYIRRLDDKTNNIESEKRHNRKRLEYKQLIDKVFLDGSLQWEESAKKESDSD